MRIRRAFDPDCKRRLQTVGCAVVVPFNDSLDARWTGPASSCAPKGLAVVAGVPRLAGARSKRDGLIGRAVATVVTAEQEALLATAQG